MRVFAARIMLSRTIPNLAAFQDRRVAQPSAGLYTPDDILFISVGARVSHATARIAQKTCSDSASLPDLSNLPGHNTVGRP